MALLKEKEKVIVCSNDEPYKVGIFLEYTNSLVNCGDNVPLVQFDEHLLPYMCFGHVLPYSRDMEARLDRLNAYQQWKLLTAIKNWDGDRELVLMRGLPGSGKSTKANKLAGRSGQIFSTDDFFCLNEEQEYRFNGSLLGRAHNWNQKRSLDAMYAGIPIVVIDNTNTTIRELRSYLPHIEAAMGLGYSVRIEEPETHWRFDVGELDKRGSHDVPLKHIEKMLNRYVKDVKIEDILFDI